MHISSTVGYITESSFLKSLDLKTAGAMVCGGALSVLLFIKAESYKRTKNQSMVSKSWNKVIFFPDDQMPCSDFIFKPQGCRNKECVASHDKNSSFYHMVSCILQAEKSIHMCMYSITCKELAEAIQVKFRQGVTVKIITDTTYMNLSGSKMKEFMEEGISIRHHRQQSYMHNKFAIIDDKLVMSGSANWTQAAIVGNNENIIISTYEDVVEPFMQEFDKLWNAFNVEDVVY